MSGVLSAPSHVREQKHFSSVVLENGDTSSRPRWDTDVMGACDAVTVNAEGLGVWLLYGTLIDHHTHTNTIQTVVS